MRVLIAGATGAIGKPLLTQLDQAGHQVFALVRSPRPPAQAPSPKLQEIVADALDPAAVLQAVQNIKPDAIINELTSLPKHYTMPEMAEAAPRDRQVRVNGNVNLLAAARASGCRRYILQSTGFWYAPGAGLAAENTPFAFEASPGVAAGCKTYAEIEDAAQSSGLDTVLLRYAFFYGPGTWFNPDGDVGNQVRQQQFPVIGKGEGLWNWVHIDDAAAATCAALSAEPGVYNVVGDDPAAQSLWLPAFAKFVAAPAPPHVSEEQALQQAGPDAVYYATKLRGASNQKAKRQLAFTPRPLEWLTA